MQSATEQIASGSLRAIAAGDGRLFWLQDDPDAEPIEDALDRRTPRQRLVTYAVATGERSRLATGLAPTHTLAATPRGAYVWDPRGGGVRLVSVNGAVDEVTRIEGHLDGELKAFDGSLFYVGKIHAGALGVARYDEEADTWDVLLDTEDPTTSAHAMIHVGPERVRYLHHAARGWVLDSIDFDGQRESVAVDLAGVMPRELSGSGRKAFIALKRGILFLDDRGERLRLVETDVPPERLAYVGLGRVGWVANAVRDPDGQLVAPWRVQIAGPKGAPRTALESARPITAIVGGEWGCACLTEGPVAEFLEPVPEDVEPARILLARER
jgi:hypothetical protein